MIGRRATLLLIIATLALGAPHLALAQEEPAVRALSAELTLDGERVTIPKLDGWVLGTPLKGTIALMRAAGDRVAQIEVRYTPGVSADQRDAYFATFHTHLQQAKLRAVHKTTVELPGSAFPRLTVTTYDMNSAGKPFRLIVWHAHRQNAAWIFTRFAPQAAFPDSSPKDTPPDPLLKTLVGSITFAP